MKRSYLVNFKIKFFIVLMIIFALEPLFITKIIVKMIIFVFLK